MNGPSGCGFASAMVNQGPKFEGGKCKRKKCQCRPNQVVSRKGIIRPDKRKKAHYF